MNNSSFDSLFAPLTIRGLTLRNRFVMPAMQRGFMDDGAPTQQMVNYLRRCAAADRGRTRVRRRLSVSNVGSSNDQVPKSQRMTKLQIPSLHFKVVLDI